MLHFYWASRTVFINLFFICGTLSWLYNMVAPLATICHCIDVKFRNWHTTAAFHNTQRFRGTPVENHWSRKYSRKSKHYFTLSLSKYCRSTKKMISNILTEYEKRKYWGTPNLNSRRLDALICRKKHCYIVIAFILYFIELFILIFDLHGP